jgi:hypothetical protein
MQGDGTTSRRGYKLGAAAALALILAPAHWQGAAAGTLAQLQFQAHTAKLVPALASRFEMARAAHMDLCLGVARTANCRAALDTALRSATQSNLARTRLYGAIAADRGELAPDVVDPHAIALKFNEDPEWKRRAKVMAHDGLPFMRMPEAGNRELVVGITPHGMLGFSLKDTTGQ